jgi:hypothetical protein
MSKVPEPIRSYQRIFAPERRIYQIDGRALPVPGGVPLRWLAYALATLLAVLALGSGSSAVPLAAAAVAALAGLGVGGRGGAALAAVAAFGGTWIAGFALGLLDWPLRLVVVPAAVATFATQATPDGRRADRFARSWLALRLAPVRRSLGRRLPPAGALRLLGGQLWVVPDERAPELRRGRIQGPAMVFFAAPVAVRRAGLRRRRLIARPVAETPRRRRGTEEARRLVLADGERLEVRP